MGLWQRIRLALSIKAHRALDEAEDPRDTVEYAYGKQLELLQDVRRGLVEVATSRGLLEAQARRLRERVPRFGEQAERALAAGREDLTRLALERKHSARAALAELERQIAEVGDEERRLAGTAERLAVHVEEFRARRNLVSARYSAAEAQLRAQERLAGLSDEVGQLWQALERAEDRTERMQARAAAIDALVGGATLALPAAGGDPLERELGAAEARAAVDAELQALKTRLEEEGRR
jgi:phage shock protein A